MRKFLLLAVLFLQLPGVNAQAITHEQRLAGLGRVWGFLKYFHPAVAGGRLNWDEVLVQKMQQIDKLGNAEELNTFYNSWLDELGEVRRCKSCATYSEQDLHTAGLDWILDDDIFTAALRARFSDVLQNRFQGNHRYVQVEKAGNIRLANEEKYADFVYPPAAYRLLGLFRYWNVVQYFFPYKKDIGEDWNKVLEEMVLPFRDAEDTLAYQAAMWKLTMRINDSHGVSLCAAYVPSCGSPFFGVRMAPLAVKLIGKQAVIYRLTSDSLSKADDIRVGDIIREVDGRTVQQIIDANWPYVGGSNLPGRYRNSAALLLYGNTATADVLLERNGKLLQKTIHRYVWEEIRPFVTASKEETWKKIEDSIGYIHMGNLKPDSVDKIMDALENTRAIIVDVRNYPQGTFQLLSRRIHEKAKTFGYSEIPDIDRPGLFLRGKDYFCGTQNKRPYKGKLILLVNERTQSHAEFSVMALQTAPDVITIGSQTAGADGNVSAIVFPGAYTSMISGIGIYYPDGKPTQRTGVHIDITAMPTLEGILQGRDEVLESALQYVRTGQ